MSNRNFDASTIIKIRKAQNAANNHNRFQTLANSSIDQLAPNPQVSDYDADIVNQYNAGSQTYYFQGFPTMTYISPIEFPALAPVQNPVLIPPTPDPPVDDTLNNVINSLSGESLLAYTNAPSNTWITISAADYARLQTNVLSTTLASSTAELFASATTVEGGITGTESIVNASTVDTPSVPPSAYVYAIAIRYGSITPNSNIAVYVNSNTGYPPDTGAPAGNPPWYHYFGFQKVGENLLPPTNPDLPDHINYYLLKQPRIARTGHSLLAIFTGTPFVDGRPSTTHLSYVQTPEKYIVKYKTGDITSVTDNLFRSTTVAVGIQALATPVIQW